MNRLIRQLINIQPLNGLLVLHRPPKPEHSRREEVHVINLSSLKSRLNPLGGDNQAIQVSLLWTLNFVLLLPDHPNSGKFEARDGVIKGNGTIFTNE